MKRLAVLIGCMMLLTSPAMAITEFSKQWKDAYADGDDVDPDFLSAVKKAKCYVCHVYKADKKKVRNEYGEAIREYLKADDFPRDYLKANPEEAKQKILAGFKKADEHKSKDGMKFGDKIKNNELPATDAYPEESD